MQQAQTYHNEDVLKALRELPKHLQEQLAILLVNRQGKNEKSFMQTENFLGSVQGDEEYTLTLDGFVPSKSHHKARADLPTATTPVYALLDGTWDDTIDTDIADANILGGNGRYILPQGQDTITIPIADCTAENLAFYGCHLVNLGDTIKFETNESLPVTITTIGEDYVNGYLMDEQRGGGSYLEYHDRPHFHMPLTCDAGGFLIIGRTIEGIGTAVSAFQIPYKSGIYMAPWCIHSDAYLMGCYMVIYSKTDHFSTVIVRQQDNTLGKIEFTAG